MPYFRWYKDLLYSDISKSLVVSLVKEKPTQQKLKLSFIFSNFLLLLGINFNGCISTNFLLGATLVTNCTKPLGRFVVRSLEKQVNYIIYLNII